MSTNNYKGSDDGEEHNKESSHDSGTKNDCYDEIENCFEHNQQDTARDSINNEINNNSDIQNNTKDSSEFINGQFENSNSGVLMIATEL